MATMKLKFGPKIGAHSAKGDVPVHYKGNTLVDGVETFHLDIPPHSADHVAAKLLKVYVVMGTDGGPAEGETPEDYLAKGHPTGSVDAGEVAAGAELAVPVPNLAPGDYHGQVILAFEDDAPTAEASATEPTATPTEDPAAATASTPTA